MPQVLEESILDAKYLLDDADINQAQNLMQAQWPDVTIQDCLLIQRPNEFDPVVKCGVGKYVQVTTNFGATHNFVLVLQQFYN